MNTPKTIKINPTKPPCITHNIYNLPKPFGLLHSITVNGVEGIRVGYNVVARCGNYAATTKHFASELPEMFVVTSLTITVKTPLFSVRNFDKLPDTRHMLQYKDVSYYEGIE